MEGMVNVVSRTCLHDWCSTIVTEKYDGYCFRCFVYTFPESPLTRNYKTKEVAVVDYVCHQFPDFYWIADKIITGGCSRRRPDLFLDLIQSVIIVEIDENMHTEYDCSCENRRIMELSRDVAHRPIVFIRFNPDSYKSASSTVSSCWGTNKKGLAVVKKSKTKEWAARLDALCNQICYWTQPDHVPEKTVEIVELFYDC